MVKYLTFIDEGVWQGKLKHWKNCCSNCIVICVPTPLNEHREPDMSYVMETTKTVNRYLRTGHLVVLESTTYPGQQMKI